MPKGTMDEFFFVNSKRHRKTLIGHVIF